MSVPESVPESVPVVHPPGPLARRHRARILGRGGRLRVLSHGLGTDQQAWSAIWPVLVGQHRVLLYDLPGASPLLPPDFDATRYRHLHAYADELLNLLDELDVTDCDYVGHSVSAMVGALAAVADPSRFGRMAWLNGSPRYLNAPGYVGGFEQADLDGLYAAMQTHYEGWVAGFAPAAVGMDMPEAVATFSAGFLAMRPDITVSIAQAIFESDLRAVLPQVRPDVALIHTRQDLAVPSEVAHYMHRHLPSSTLHWIDGHGHLPHLTQPQAVLSALERALG